MVADKFIYGEVALGAAICDEHGVPYASLHISDTRKSYVGVPNNHADQRGGGSQGRAGGSSHQECRIFRISARRYETARKPGKSAHREL